MTDDHRQDGAALQSAPLNRPAWLDEFEAKAGRRLRVLHVGNIANNAYINAKIMRKIGIDADVVCADYYHIMGTPEWEEAEFKSDYGDPFFPDWWQAARGYERPKWFFQGPRKLCQEALAAQFDDPRAAREKHAIMVLAANYISFRDSSLSRPGGASWLRRMRRRLAFTRYLTRFALSNPVTAWAALGERVPAVAVINTGVRLVFLALAFVATAFLSIVERVLRLFTLRTSLLGVRFTILAAELKWTLRDVMSNRIIRPMIPAGSELFRRMTGRNFSEVTGFSVAEWISGRQMARLAARHRTETTPAGNPANGNPTMTSSERARYYAEASRYLDRVASHVAWGMKHRGWHANLGAAEYAADVALANGLVVGWEEVYRNYDVIQCYSTDGIVPMALGWRHFFNYEHGTLRAIPFEDNPVGRLTATAYRSGDKVLMTNIDNYASCERLGIAEDRIVALPHALDDAKIHRFVAAHPHVRPSGHEAPLFFSSARQHWLDRDPGYAKGNDVFLRAAARAVHAGRDLRIVLVEWGRDLEATKDLLSDLKLGSRVTWVPTMTGEELWQRYLQCHAVVDQFVIPAFGRVTFDSLTIGRRVISSLDIALATRFFGEAPPMLVASTVDEAEKAVAIVLDDPEDKAAMGRKAAEWARKRHSSQRILDLQLEAYRPTLGLSG